MKNLKELPQNIEEIINNWNRKKHYKQVDKNEKEIILRFISNLKSEQYNLLALQKLTTKASKLVIDNKSRDTKSLKSIIYLNRTIERRIIRKDCYDKEIVDSNQIINAINYSQNWRGQLILMRAIANEANAKEKIDILKSIRLARKSFYLTMKSGNGLKQDKHSKKIPAYEIYAFRDATESLNYITKLCKKHKLNLGKTDIKNLQNTINKAEEILNISKRINYTHKEESEDGIKLTYINIAKMLKYLNKLSEHQLEKALHYIEEFETSNSGIIRKVNLHDTRRYLNPHNSEVDKQMKIQENPKFYQLKRRKFPTKKKLHDYIPTHKINLSGMNVEDVLNSFDSLN